jgi:hypothetical protein
MCFSAESSFGSALVIGGFGLATLRKVRDPRELLLGALPLMFATHQVLEGINWLALEGRVSQPLGEWSIYLYLVFAQALLPAISPWCFWLEEPDPKRRRLLIPFLIIGSCLCAFVLWKLSNSDLVATIRGHDITYDDAISSNWWFGFLYIVSTCTPPFLSRYPWMIAFALLDVAGLIFTLLFEAIFVISLWCLLTGLVSILVYLHFRRKRNLDHR